MMKTKISSAASASSKMTSMGVAKVGAGAILALLAACASAPLPPAPVSAPRATPDPTPPRTASTARWVAADWSELPGWGQDDAADWWPALRAGCGRPAAGWSAFCARALLQAPNDPMEATVWLMKQLRPWRMQSDSSEPGLLTGYVEPQLNASRTRQGAFQWPLHALPADPQLRRTSRREIEANARFTPLELVYLDDPMAVLNLQIQGSGRLLVQEADGRQRAVRVNFAGHNEQPFESVAKALIERGELRDASWPGLRDWARQNPGKVREALAVNPRVVYFREEPLQDLTQGPRGAQGLPLMPGRSVAVDRNHIALGTPLWLSAGPLQRVVMAQDTGGAITGPQRADYFWGWGSEAEAQAARTKLPLKLWALWPVGTTPSP